MDKDLILLLESIEDIIYSKLLDIGNENYKNGYGPIINKIQEEFLIIPKNLINKKENK